jgi:hypothetical protein
VTSTCVVDVVTTPNAPQATHLVVDANDVYFSYHLGGKIYRAPKTGGTTTTFGTVSGWIKHLAADAAHVFAVNTGSSSYRVDELTKSSGALRKMYESGFASSIDVDNVVVDTNALYLAAGKNAGGTVDLLRIDRATAGSSPVNAAWSPGKWLAHAGPNLYWATGGKIFRAAKSGAGAPQQLAWPGSGMSAGIAADGADVFYIESKDLGVRKITGTTDVALHAGTVSVDYAWSLLVDATDVYVLTTDANDVGTIYRVPRAGGSLTAFATDQARARGLALDGAHVYWSVSSVPGISSSNAVVRKAK